MAEIGADREVLGGKRASENQILRVWSDRINSFAVLAVFAAAKIFDGEGSEVLPEVSVRRALDADTNLVSSVFEDEVEQPVIEPNLPQGAFGEVFGKISGAEENAAREMVGDYRDVFVNEGFSQMKFFLSGWGEHLENESLEKGLDPEIVKGIIFIESRGNRYAVSGAGAAGVAQLMPDTARRYGLEVDADNDERENPYVSIIAATSYLRDLKWVFGENLGIAVWAYHAGEGNVMDALRHYFIEKTGEDVGDYEASFFKETDEQRLAIEKRVDELIRQTGLSVHDLLNSESVGKNVLAGLEDETEEYPYKVVAAAQVLESKG